MYSVQIDGNTLYSTNSDDYVLISAVADLDMSDSGSFSFIVPAINPEYDNIKNRKSVITVKQDSDEIFCGEVQEIQTDYYKNKTVYAVGELSYLYDTIQPQGEYHDKTPAEFLQILLDNHNANVEERKKFFLGNVNVTDPNNSIYRFTNYETTLDCIRNKLVGSLGGYIKIRKVGGIKYLDWLTEDSYGTLCNQTIQFGENLLDYSSTISPKDIATAIIPLGAKLETSPISALEAYTDITSVNGGKNYIFSQSAVDNFGWIEKVVKFENVTIPSNLLQKGQLYLSASQFENLVLNVSAVDLSTSVIEYDRFRLGDKVRAIAEPYGMDKAFIISKLSIDILNAANNKLTLGFENSTGKALSSVIGETIVEHIETEVKEINSGIKTELEEMIAHVTDMITGAKGGYKVSEYDENGMWYRDLYMDAPNVDDATNIIQINMNGIGFSTNGYYGPYSNAWTIDGNFVADYITTGSMLADRIRGGTLEIGGAGIAKDGSIIIYDKDGNEIGRIDVDGIKILLGEDVGFIANGEKVVMGDFSVATAYGRQILQSSDEKTGMSGEPNELGKLYLWAGYESEGDYAFLVNNRKQTHTQQLYCHDDDDFYQGRTITDMLKILFEGGGQASVHGLSMAPISLHSLTFNPDVLECTYKNLSKLEE